MLGKQAQRHYAEVRTRVNGPSVRKILALLAAEEEKRAAALETMKSGADEKLEAPSLLKEARVGRGSGGKRADRDLYRFLDARGVSALNGDRAGDITVP